MLVPQDAEQANGGARVFEAIGHKTKGGRFVRRWGPPNPRRRPSEEHCGRRTYVKSSATGEGFRSVVVRCATETNRNARDGSAADWRAAAAPAASRDGK